MVEECWGWRTRIGVLVTHKDAVPECEFWGMAPPGVTVHAARFRSPRPLGGDFSAETGKAVANAADISDGLQYLGMMHAGAIAMCFGTGSFLGGPEFDQSFSEQARERANGVPVSLAGPAMLEAANLLKVRRPFLVTPTWFTDDLRAAAERYYRDAGLDVAAVMQFDLGPGWREVPPSQVYDKDGHLGVHPATVYQQIRSAFPSGADSVMVVGNGFRAVEAIDPLEQDL